MAENGMNFHKEVEEKIEEHRPKPIQLLKREIDKYLKEINGNPENLTHYNFSRILRVKDEIQGIWENEHTVLLRLPIIIKWKVASVRASIAKFVSDTSSPALDAEHTAEHSIDIVQLEMDLEEKHLGADTSINGQDIDISITTVIIPANPLDPFGVTEIWPVNDPMTHAFAQKALWLAQKPSVWNMDEYIIQLEELNSLLESNINAAK